MNVAVALASAPAVEMRCEHRALRLHALVWIHVVGKEPALGREREVEGEAAARREVLASGDEQRLQIPAGRDQGHGVARGEHSNKTLREPERAQVLSLIHISEPTRLLS